MQLDVVLNSIMQAMNAPGVKVSLLAGTELQAMPSSKAGQAGSGTSSLRLSSECNATDSLPRR